MVRDTGRLRMSQSDRIYRALFYDGGSGVVISLRSDESTFGLLCFAYAHKRRFTPDDVRLYNASAEIAGVSLHRAVVLEALERQVEVRTQHLSTLYQINAVANEPLELEKLVEKALALTLEAMGSRFGAIHFLDDTRRELILGAGWNLPVELAPDFENLSLEVDFWAQMMRSTNPRVIPNLRVDSGVPAEIANLGLMGGEGYISAPMRVEGRVLGLLSAFGGTVLERSIEDITLFMTIADQIGALVERARLMEQAEQAAVVEERQRLARELHDSVTQLLYSQVLFAGASRKVLAQGNQALAEEHLDRIDQAAQQALKEMRLLVYQLRPTDYLDEGLIGALERRLQSVEKRTGIDARLVVEGGLDLDEAAEMALYRIAEEALNNTLKHAGARSVLVLIKELEGVVQLEIADDGRGFDLSERARSGGMGLANMRDRTAALGGELQILTNPGGGTRIFLEFEVAK